MSEYSIEDYQGLISLVKKQGFHFRAFPTHFDQIELEGCAFLRHDVDYSPDLALKIARINKECGIRATFFFLPSSPFYNILESKTGVKIREIFELDQDIALM